MYIMIAFMGSAFAGARASSHDFLSLRLSVSSLVAGLRVVAFEDALRYESHDVSIPKMRYEYL